MSLEFGYKEVNGSGFGYEDVLLIYQNIGFNLGIEVFHTYFAIIFKALGVALFLSCLMTFSAGFYKWVSFTQKRNLIFPIVSIIAIIFVFQYTVLFRTSFPAPMKFPSLLYYAFKNNLYSGSRDQPYLTPVSEPIARHIVWIVDESVRGNFLQINDFDKETTPFLKSIDQAIINYGTAGSGSVCSDYSHIMLMSGLNINELPDKKGLARKKPTIFQYANQTRMQSNLLYAPGYEDVPKGYMTQSDFSHIKNRYHTKKIFPDIAPYLIDLKSIDILEEIIDTQESSFTYFLKYGCHFHYESTYPPDKRYFEPVQDATSWERDNRKELLNSYYNAIRWEVDYFFETLYKRFEGEDVLFIYTSDHGQHLMEYPEIKLTHCLKKAAPNEMAMVPLFCLPMNEQIKSALTALFRTENVDKASHFNIFPSTLVLMGYEPKEVYDLYGKSLFDSLENTERVFVSGDIFGRSRMFKNSFNYSSKKE